MSDKQSVEEEYAVFLIPVVILNLALLLLMLVLFVSDTPIALGQISSMLILYLPIAVVSNQFIDNHEKAAQSVSSRKLWPVMSIIQIAAITIMGSYLVLDITGKNKLLALLVSGTVVAGTVVAIIENVLKTAVQRNVEVGSDNPEGEDEEVCNVVKNNNKSSNTDETERLMLFSGAIILLVAMVIGLIACAVFNTNMWVALLGTISCTLGLLIACANMIICVTNGIGGTENTTYNTEKPTETDLEVLDKIDYIMDFIEDNNLSNENGVKETSAELNKLADSYIELDKWSRKEAVGSIISLADEFLAELQMFARNNVRRNRDSILSQIDALSDWMHKALETKPMIEPEETFEDVRVTMGDKADTPSESECNIDKIQSDFADLVSFLDANDLWEESGLHGTIFGNNGLSDLIECYVNMSSDYKDRLRDSIQDLIDTATTKAKSCLNNKNSIESLLKQTEALKKSIILGTGVKED